MRIVRLCKSEYPLHVETMPENGPVENGAKGLSRGKCSMHEDRWVV